MPINKNKIKYVPGTYAKKRPDTDQLIEQYFRDWEKKRLKMKEKNAIPTKMAPAICFSRKIGVGTIEIADIIAEKINYRIADREILDHMAKNAKLSNETVSFFDERYPGKMVELSKMLFGEKSFIMSDYIRNIVSAVFAFADMGATIFVGRGIHLILPRERVLAVRFICSDEYRIKRLAEVMDYLDMEEVKKILAQIDKEQRDFFKKAFGKKDATPYEFDLVINCDYINNPNWAAGIVIQAFNKKFGLELNTS